MRTPRELRAQADTSTWPTCAQAADLLGRSPNTIRNWERRGKLHPVRVERRNESGGPSEVLVYDPEELGRLPRRKPDPSQVDPGEVAARAFEAFDAGRSVRQVVVALRIPPAEADELHEWWTAQGGSEVVVNQAAQAELERFVGPFVGVAGLVERLEALLGERTGPVTRTAAADTPGGSSPSDEPPCTTGEGS